MQVDPNAYIKERVGNTEGLPCLKQQLKMYSSGRSEFEIAWAMSFIQGSACLEDSR